MKAGGSSPRQPSSQSRVPWFIAMAVVAALGTLLGIVQVFGTFMGYDDEGYMMAVVGRMLSGKVLYKEVPTVYGPFYFLFKHVLHAVLGIPLTNNATRVVSLISTVCVSGLLSWTTFRLTRNAALAAVAWVLSVIHLRVFGLEPGHPQELITVAIAAASVFLVSLDDAGTRNRAIIYIGLIVGALLATKVNVGILFLVSLVLCMVLAIGRTGWRPVLFIGVAMAAIFLPFAIIGNNVSIPRFLLLASTVSGSVLSLVIVSAGFGWRPTPTQVLLGMGGVAGAAAVSLAFSLAEGASLPDVLESVWFAPKRLAANYKSIPTRISTTALPLTVLSLALVTLNRCRTRLLGRAAQGRLDAILMWAKLFYAVWLLRLFVSGQFVGLTSLLAPSTSLLWLVLFTPGPTTESCPRIGARFIAFIAALQPMQVYPIAGSQCAIGTLLFIPICLLCLFDFVRWAHERYALDRLRRIPASAWRWASASVSVAIFITHMTPLWMTYGLHVPIPAVGAGWVRVPKEKAETYSWLIGKLKDHGKPFVTTTGFNSLHVWTGLEPRTPLIIGNSLDIFSPEQLQSMVGELEKNPDAIVVRHPSFVATPPSGPNPTNTFLSFISLNYEVLESKDSFELMTRKDRSPLQKE